MENGVVKYNRIGTIPTKLDRIANLRQVGPLALKIIAKLFKKGVMKSLPTFQSYNIGDSSPSIGIDYVVKADSYEGKSSLCP